MSAQSNAMSESVETQKAASAIIPASRVFYWSVRRELWENRSIYIAPLSVAGVALLAFLLSAMGGVWQRHLRVGPDPTREAVVMPFDIVAALLMGTCILVSFFYCLDALHGERRDRSILFWKSLPVSDLTTVLAKASIVLVVLPLLTFAITVVTQWIMLLVGSALLAGSGVSVGMLWAQVGFGRMSLLLLYHLVTSHALWPFPVYCWLLLVSGWARRATFLWAALPVVAISAVEVIVFRTWHFAALVGSRLIGAAPAMVSTPEEAFPSGPMTHITPGLFLSSPGLWIGLIVAAVFLGLAVQVRRYREPI
jgi:ABC-2 type transport system permease protein